MSKIINSILALMLMVSMSLTIILTAPVLAYPTYPANAVITRVVPWTDNATVGAGNIGVGMAGSHYKEYCAFDNTITSVDGITPSGEYVIRQAGTITRVKLYTASITNLTGFYIKVWRPTATYGATCNLVGTSENLVASLATNTISTIDLTLPITGVMPGDILGYRIGTSDNVTSFYARTGLGVLKFTNYITDATPTPIGFDWSTGTSLSGYMIPIEAYMSVGPQFVFIGDSIISLGGIPLQTTVPYLFGSIAGYTVQNMGIPSGTTTQCKARFTRDVINLNPKVVVIEGAINDGYLASTQNTYVSNIKYMLDTIQATASIDRVILILIYPSTNPNIREMYQRDRMNNSLASLAQLYSKVTLCDSSTYVGIYRSGGATRNLWDIVPAYTDAGGVHITSVEGRTQAAQSIVDSLSKPKVNWYSNSWLYRKAITVSRAIGATVDYPMSLRINRSAGTDNATDVFVGTKCNADYSDIMFTAADGTTPVGWWTETYTASVAQGIVDLGYVDTGATTYYMYYGNTGAVSYNNGRATFIHFDDFSGIVLDAERWNLYGDIALAGGICTIGNPAGANSGITFADTFGIDIKLKTRAKTSVITASTSILSIFIDANNSVNYYAQPGTATYFGYDIKATVGQFTDTGIVKDTANYHIYETIRDSNTDIKHSVDTTQVTNNVQVPTGSGALYQNTDATAVLLVDYTIISHYLATVPSWGTWGVEESYPQSPTNLTISPASGKVSISWVKGVNSTNTVVLYKIGSYPASETDGTLAYSGSGTSVVVTGLTNGSTIYVRGWGEKAYSGATFYSSSYASGVGLPSVVSETNEPLAQAIPTFMVIGFLFYAVARIKIASNDDNMGFVIVEIVAEGMVIIIGAVLVANMLV